MSKHDELLDALSVLVGTLERGFSAGRSCGEPVTKHDLEKWEQEIMSQITDITAGIQTNLDEITKDIAALTAAGVGGVPASDIAALQTVATNIAAVTTALDAIVATIPAPVTPAKV